MARNEWLLVGATLLLGAVLFEVRGGSPHPGDLVDAPISLVPNDRFALECSLPLPVGRYRCAYTDGVTPSTPPPTDADRLAPYVTTARGLFLVPGLFQVPSVRLFAARVPPTQRFVARCKLRLVQQVPGAATRFRPTDGWGKETAPVWVAEPASCEPE